MGRGQGGRKAIAFCKEQHAPPKETRRPAESDVMEVREEEEAMEKKQKMVEMKKRGGIRKGEKRRTEGERKNERRW